MKKIFTLIATALMTLGINAQTTIYSWESPEGTPVQTGGTIAYVNGDGDRLNYLNNGHYTICLNGKKANLDDTTPSANAGKMVITLNEALAAGDVITITGYIVKNESKEVNAYFIFADGVNAESPNFGDAENIDATFNGSIGTKTLNVPDGGAGSKSITFTRGSKAGTNLFITKLTITRTGGSGEGGGGGDTGLEETYSALSETNGLGAAYAAVVDADNIATNVVNGNSIVKFGTANVEVEAVGSADPADKPEGGQDITIGAQISAEEHTYELVSINSTKPIKWEVGNRGDISYYYIKGTGTPAVSMVAEEIYTEGEPTGKYRVKVTAFDPTVGGEPASGLYYKFTTKVDGALKVGIWANKGNRTTFLVDGETKKVSDYIVEGYLEGETDTEGKLKWLTNDEIVAIHDAAGTASYVIGNGKNFWGNAIIDAKAGKTYWLFQGNSQIGFQGYTFVPGAKKEDITKIESIQTKTNNVWNADAPMYNLSGQKVDKSYKGIVIQNGRKFFNK